MSWALKKNGCVPSKAVQGTNQLVFVQPHVSIFVQPLLVVNGPIGVREGLHGELLESLGVRKKDCGTLADMTLPLSAQLSVLQVAQYFSSSWKKWKGKELCRLWTWRFPN